MSVWNGKTVTAEAHRIALQIEGKTALASFPAGFNIAAVKADLRRLYVATGGKRGPAVGFDPTTQQLRDVYNGVATGAEIWAAHSGEMPEIEALDIAEQLDAADRKPADPAAEALKKLLGVKDVDEAAIADMAVKAVDRRVGDVLASMSSLIATEVSRQVRTIDVKIASLPAKRVEKAHLAFERVLRYCANRKSVMLVGPAGSGKTTLAEQVAETLGLPFYMSGKCADEVKITGYMDAGGTYRRTAFREAYEKGGLFLFDEMDGWSPDAIIAVNAPLAGQWGDFPDGMIKRHPDFVAIGAANTYGRGADRQYVGREQLDAATLDRFAVIEIEYDEDLELAISCDRDWTLYVQKVRKAVETAKVRHVVSPRASIEGGIMLKAGEPRADVENAYIWKGLDEPVMNRVKAEIR